MAVPCPPPSMQVDIIYVMDLLAALESSDGFSGKWQHVCEEKDHSNRVLVGQEGGISAHVC